ncbi:MAG: hypothetical protein C4326_01625 [Ignavibacteria bacterium]
MKSAIATFLSSPAFAVVGVSRHERKFGSIVFRAMRSRGFAVYPVHPHLQEFDGLTCVPSVRALPCEVRADVPRAGHIHPCPASLGKQGDRQISSLTPGGAWNGSSFPLDTLAKVSYLGEGLDAVCTALMHHMNVMTSLHDAF